MFAGSLEPLTGLEALHFYQVDIFAPKGLLCREPQKSDVRLSVTFVRTYVCTSVRVDFGPFLESKISESARKYGFRWSKKWSF